MIATSAWADTQWSDKAAARAAATTPQGDRFTRQSVRRDAFDRSKRLEYGRLCAGRRASWCATELARQGVRFGRARPCLLKPRNEPAQAADLPPLRRRAIHG